MEVSSTPSITTNKIRYISRRRHKSNRYNSTTASKSDQNYNSNNMDIILIPVTNNNENGIAMEHRNITSLRKNNESAVLSDSSRSNKDTNIEKLFPSPGVIIKDIYEIYNAKNQWKKETPLW